ncbi:uncharacterized protein LOC134820811 isoform X1 [Bolinopsis microptera]|uniref:uncharacterized protein LOC134820811 isoform X1 n=2 Tax=Bolinopsis microptera TaxID=2820187 RepID=UPI003079674B
MNTDLENVLVEESIKLIEDFLQSRTVNVVCCQKVVHHRVKTYLESKGIMVLERLSVMYAEDLATLCRTSLSPSISHWNIGFVQCVQRLEVGGKKFLHFQPTDTTHFGVIILHSLTKCISEEMELCINQSLLSCNNALSAQSLVHGSSCLYSTLLSRLSLESHDSVIRAVSATLSEFCPKESTLVCGNGHVWELEQTPSEDNFISDRCLCRSYRAVGDLDTENFTPLSDYTTSVTYKQTDKPTPLNLEYEQGNDKVLHPTNVVLEVFRKAFQILEVLCQSELPVLV